VIVVKVSLKINPSVYVEICLDKEHAAWTISRTHIPKVMLEKLKENQKEITKNLEEGKEEMFV